MNANQFSEACDSVRPLLWGLGVLVAAFGIAYAFRLATGNESAKGS